MPKTRLISPGSIPNHKLLKNLQLQDNYISNDGGDEGIRITDAGLVGIGVTDPASPLEVFSTSSQLKLSYDATYYADISVANDGHLELATTGSNNSDITLDAAGNLFLEPGRYVYMQKSGASDGRIQIDLNSDPLIEVESDAASADKFQLQVNASGATTLATVDSSDAAAHLTLDPDGDLIVSGADVRIDALKKLYLDSGGNTYIVETTADTVGHVVGGDTLIILDENGGDGNVVLFKTACAGFTKIAETFSDDTIIGSGGTDDTHIDFRHSNKISLAVTGNITNLNLIFPIASGNFLLLLTYDGDHTITNYKVYENDESAADGATDVLWPGGTKPDNTASGVDILSFFYDATPGSDKCYGVASLAFATP